MVTGIVSVSISLFVWGPQGAGYRRLQLQGSYETLIALLLCNIGRVKPP